MKRLRPKTEFSRNVVTLMSGTIVAQAIPIAITPILTRLYSPESFGLLALFLSFIFVLGSIANARYELAILLPKNDEDALNIAALGLVIAFCFSLILFVIVVVFNSHLVRLLNTEEIGFWLYFIPFSVLMVGLFNVLNYLNTRKKLYKDIARANIYKSLGMAVVQITVGSVKAGATGLISGEIISRVISNVRLIKNIKAHYDLRSVRFFSMKGMAKQYVKFPKFSLWGTLANTSSIHLTNVLISMVYNIATLGFYTLVQRVLSTPTSLIGASIGQVFFQEAVVEKEKTGIAKEVFRKTLIRLFLAGLFIFSILYWIVEDLFAFVFGEEWRIAGVYAQILIPLFYVVFFVSPLTLMNLVFEKNEIGMYWQFGLLFLNLILVFIAQHLNFGFETYLYMAVFVIAPYYLLMLFIVSQYNKNTTHA